MTALRRYFGHEAAFLSSDERTFSDTVGLLEGADRRHSRFAKMKEAAKDEHGAKYGLQEESRKKCNILGLFLSK